MNPQPTQSSLSPSSDILKELARPFPPSQVKTRTQKGQKLHYIDIASVQDRLDEVLGLDWRLTLDHETLDRIDDDHKGRPQWLARCRAAITISVAGCPTRQGFGVAQGLSAENVLLTAQATAIKKAAVQFGIGRELWHAARRNFIDLAPRLVPLARIVIEEDPDIDGHEAEKNLKEALIKGVERWQEDDSSVPRPQQGDPKARVRLVHAWLTQAGSEPACSEVHHLAHAVLQAAGEGGI